MSANATTNHYFFLLREVWNLSREAIGLSSRENRIGEFFHSRRTPKMIPPGAENVSVRPRCCISLAPCRSFPTSVGVARERSETDPLSRTLTAVYVRPLVRELGASHAATSPAGCRDPAVSWRTSCQINALSRGRRVSRQGLLFFSSL